ncbi:hypothetical protein HYC85_011373 [Camellia sinensis]|uniref:PGG domain-containing protein n=1 Tax=Camellia sinensis TaxID=4442 RepID=A0A7J7H8V9_CAMSI|nr:hypothetical protein HYC85_011373 [Camellia sinensis]
MVVAGLRVGSPCGSPSGLVAGSPVRVDERLSETESKLESQSNPRLSAIFLVTSVIENQQVRQRLMEATEAGDISLLYGCIQDYPKFLDSIDEIPFVNTPLHIAALAGHAHFALEMMRLMPSFGKKVNPQGLTPLDLALQSREGLRPSDPTLQKMKELSQEDLYLRNRITLIISRLINFDKELIRVKGRESFTPLHYVAKKGDIDLLAEFLYACPKSIMDRTIRDETAPHIAMKNSKLQAFESPARAPLTDSRSSGQTPARAADAHFQKFLQTGPRSSAQLPALERHSQPPARAANPPLERPTLHRTYGMGVFPARADKPKSGQLDLVPKLNQPAPNLPNTTQDSI